MLTVSAARFLKRGTAAAAVSGEAVFSAARAGERVTVVLDAGHGGGDSGAVGVNGCLEKELCLDVTRKLAALLRFSGVSCIETRTADEMLDDGAGNGRRKMRDLRARVKAAEEAAETGGRVLFVSVHMNIYTSPDCAGMQVWYSKNAAESRTLAASIQGAARSWLDRENGREIKKATSAIYVLDRAEVPAVLVECGFLSNPEECARLCTDEYRTLTALAVYTGILTYLGAPAE